MDRAAMGDGRTDHFAMGYGRGAVGPHPHPTPAVAGDIGDAEAVNPRVRLIALENQVVALLAGAPESQSELVCEMAACISPRQGTTPQRPTTEARNMRAPVDRASHHKTIWGDCGQ